MRWYDIEPDVCMAISMIECAEKKAQVQYAEYIKNTTINNIEKKYQRWYDKNETISTAFSYLKGTTKTIQKEVSLSVLALMKSAVA